MRQYITKDAQLGSVPVVRLLFVDTCIRPSRSSLNTFTLVVVALISLMVLLGIETHRFAVNLETADMERGAGMRGWAGGERVLLGGSCALRQRRH